MSVCILNAVTQRFITQACPWALNPPVGTQSCSSVQELIVSQLSVILRQLFLLLQLFLLFRHLFIDFVFDIFGIFTSIFC